MKREGARVAVIRPDDPTMAIELAKLAHETNDVEAFSQIPAKVGGYRFVGYLSKSAAHVLDENGKKIGRPKAGDSFVHPDGLTRGHS